jgi:hypothetical protein
MLIVLPAASDKVASPLSGLFSSIGGLGAAKSGDKGGNFEVFT